MIVENWLSGNLRAPSEGDAFKALEELEEVGEEIQRLTVERKHWEAYTKLTGSIAFLNVASENEMPCSSNSRSVRMASAILRLTSVHFRFFLLSS